MEVPLPERFGGVTPEVEAAEALARGELVAIPTETVYGLAARADDDSAVARIFAAKGRPADHPLIVHVADIAAAEEQRKSTRRAQNVLGAAGILVLLVLLFLGHKSRTQVESLEAGTTATAAQLALKRETFGGLFEISAADSLTLALAKRVRELLLGLPGLLAWQLAEGRRVWMRRREPPA